MQVSALRSDWRPFQVDIMLKTHNHIMVLVGLAAEVSSFNTKRFLGAEAPQALSHCIAPGHGFPTCPNGPMDLRGWVSSLYSSSFTMLQPFLLHDVLFCRPIVQSV